MADICEESTANCNYEVVEKYLSFGKALDKLIERENDTTDSNEYGIRICSWNKSFAIKIQKPDEGSKMTGRYLYKSLQYKNYKEDNIPWVPNNEHIFNNFWELVKFVKNEDVIPDNKNYETLFRNPNIQKEFDDCRRKCEEFKKDYVKYRNLVNKDNDKCSPHCAKKCLDECNKVETKPNNNQTIIVKGNIRKLADTFDEIIDALLS